MIDLRLYQKPPSPREGGLYGKVGILLDCPVKPIIVIRHRQVLSLTVSAIGK
jgi:hypothetical protein